MRPTTRSLGIVFAVVVLFSVTQVAWWVVYQFRETERLESAARAYADGDTAAAVHALGIGEDGGLDDRFHRRRFMFASEGAVLGLCALLGVVFFYMLLMRERRVMRERERFLAGATHEFKTPLATIKLGLETLLERRVPSEKAAAYLLSMAGEVDRLERGVGNILAAAGLQSADRTVSLEPGDLVADVQEVVDEFAPRFVAAGIEFTAEFPTSLRLQRDRTALRIVVHNLLDNALRYNRRGDSVRLLVAEDAARGEPRAVLRLADSGPGMEQEELKRVFQPFYRGVGATHHGGSGLGLHLVREFVRMHGGSVVAESDGPGRGTTFEVRLPRRPKGDAA